VASIATALVVARFVPALRRGALVAAKATPIVIERIEGGALVDGGYLVESGDAGIKLFFNEGSVFELERRTRGRVRQVTADGATLAIEKGAASFRITPDATKRWSIEAGPFQVTVKGTVFDLSWDPVDERFDLALRSGRVVVNRPMAGGSIVLRAGQHLSVRLPIAETVITEAATEDATAPREDGPSESPPEPAGAVRPTTSPRPGRARTAAAPALRGNEADNPAPGVRRWPAMLAAGQWDRILTDAERRGLDDTLEHAPTEDLFALADAARYRHRAELASAALLAQRRRYPDASRSLDALFLLGRVEESRQGGSKRAIGFYDQYLTRAPSGRYAAEALGRKMMMASDGGEAARARTIAGQYLFQFPDGSYAAAARALTRAP
jgi:TolA-binding protein